MLHLDHQQMRPGIAAHGVWCPGQARVGDGLDAVAEAAEAVRSGAAPPLDVLVVDASSGDASQVGCCQLCGTVHRGANR